MKLDSKYFDSIRVTNKNDRLAKPRVVLCNWPGCQETGEHKAPQGRGREGLFFQFCLDHVKQYNREYNFFEGMSDTEVSEFQKSAAIGHRPTWTIGANSMAHGVSPPSSKASAAGADPLRRPKVDPFEFFAQTDTGKPRKRTAEARPPVGKVALKNLRALNLEGGATKEEIKTRFKELVKRHHPDANGGDRGSEDRLREIIVAYNFLKQAGLC